MILKDFRPTLKNTLTYPCFAGTHSSPDLQLYGIRCQISPRMDRQTAELSTELRQGAAATCTISPTQSQHHIERDSLPLCVLWRLLERHGQGSHFSQIGLNPARASATTVSALESGGKTRMGVICQIAGASPCDGSAVELTGKTQMDGISVLRQVGLHLATASLHLHQLWKDEDVCDLSYQIRQAYSFTLLQLHCTSIILEFTGKIRIGGICLLRYKSHRYKKKQFTSQQPCFFLVCFIVCRESQNEPFAFSLGLKAYGNEETVLICSMREKKWHQLSVRDQFSWTRNSSREGQRLSLHFLAS